MTDSPEAIDYQKWLDSLGVGQELAYAEGYTRVCWRIAKVLKRTAKGRIVTENYSFNADGSTYGARDRSSPSQCRPVTTQVRETIEVASILTQIEAANFGTLPLEKLRQIIAVIKS